MLTHARVAAADGGLERDFEVLRQSVLARAHDLDPIVADIAEIRQHRRGRDDPWRVADLPGGLLDLGLAAEFLQLAGAAPEAGVAALAETFGTAGERGLIDADAARDLAAAVLWQNLGGFFRMTCAGAFDPESATAEQRAIHHRGDVRRGAPRGRTRQDPRDRPAERGARANALVGLIPTVESGMSSMQRGAA